MLCIRNQDPYINRLIIWEESFLELAMADFHDFVYVERKILVFAIFLLDSFTNPDLAAVIDGHCCSRRW